MFNIQKAVSRLNYAPKLNEIEVTDIAKGLAVFKPKADKPVSFSALKENLAKAGYTLASADITISGKLTNDGGLWFVTSGQSGQRFAIAGKIVDTLTGNTTLPETVEVTGQWTTDGKGTAARETVDPVGITPIETASLPTKPVSFVHASFVPNISGTESESEREPQAPIRTTSPGLTVYKGGAVTPRIYFEKQSFGDLNVRRQIAEFSFSYTPSPRLQLEAVVPFSRTSFDEGARSGSGFGLGNILLWGKYRFFRKVKTYGDRQASARVGIELPTGKKSAPSADLDVPGFIRRQLTPIKGGLSPHGDISFSQASGRFIFGGSIEAIYRTERDGYRLGHEVRLNSDFEYVVFPRQYKKPGGEIFAILETTLVKRGEGRYDSVTVRGSSETEYYLSPGLQYAARPQFVFEGSVQFPVFRSAAPAALQTNYNLLLGMRYLF